MNATINPLSMDVVRAEAAFVSALQPSDAPDPSRSGGSSPPRCATSASPAVPREWRRSSEITRSSPWPGCGGLEGSSRRRSHGPNQPQRSFTLPVAAAVAHAA